MKIQDYLHLYMGCEMWTRDAFGRTAIRKLTAIVGTKAIYDCDDTEDVDMANSWDMNYTSDPDKPLLRPLSDITYAEAVSIEADFIEVNHDTETVTAVSFPSDYAKLTPEDTLLLLNKGFDLFGLIDAGLALPRLINS